MKIRCKEDVGGFDLNDENKILKFFKGKKYDCEFFEHVDDIDWYLIYHSKGKLRLTKAQLDMFFDILKSRGIKL